MLDAVLWIMARDKEKYIEMSLRGALSQTFPCRIVISDQGSTDLTREVCLYVLKDYDGPHTIELRNCPEISNKGHAGQNDHIRWFHKNVKYDVCVLTSADDVAHPNRMEETIKAYETHHPAMVLTKQLFVEPQADNKLVPVGHSMFPDESRFITGVEIIRNMIGGSSSQSWTYDFLESIEPMEGITLQDLYMPFMASQTKEGCYYLNEPVQSFILWADPNNTGAGGVMKTLTDEKEKAKLTEVAFYQITNAWLQAARKSEELFPEKTDDRQALYEEIVKNTAGWCDQRNVMTMNRIEPKGASI